MAYANNQIARASDGGNDLRSTVIRRFAEKGQSL
jgi:hypothetical protein